MSGKPEIILIREGLLQSLGKDAGVFVMFVALIGLGRWIDSTALQWVGALVGFSTIFAWVMRVLKDNRMTIEQARKRLDEIEAGQ